LRHSFASGLKMKISSARQVWHDAFYTQGTSLSDPELGVSGQGYRDDTANLMHKAGAGRIQSAISYLPEVHRRFGMMMYAPYNFIMAEDVECSVDFITARIAAVFVSRERPLSHKKYSALPYIVQAMLHRFRAIVTNKRTDPFNGDSGNFSNKKLRTFIFEEYGVVLAKESFWREYGTLIEMAIALIDNLDKQCLVPVTKVVDRHHENYAMRQDEERTWMQAFTARFWDECFKEIKQYCEELHKPTTTKAST